MSRDTMWLLILIQIQYVSYGNGKPFALEPTDLKANEGSCVELKCIPTNSMDTQNALWYWMKDAKWIEGNGYDGSTVIYSSDEQRKTVSPLFKNRVWLVGHSPESVNSNSYRGKKEICHILICDLKKNDTGNYSFRFESPNDKWLTKPEAKLTIIENKCLITFIGPQVVKEDETITLKCSTLSSCSLCPNINILGQKASVQSPPPVCETNGTSKFFTYPFTASWQHDGAVFSCQTPDNTDKYLSRHIKLTVKYAPKDVVAEKSSYVVKERSSVTLTCSAKGNPKVTFSWFKTGQAGILYTGPEWKITYIKESHSGSYYCSAVNELGIKNSSQIEVNVLYKPEVEVKDSGRYTCKAKNTIAEGQSTSYDLKVYYKPRSIISIRGAHNNQVKVDDSVTLTCDTQAYPDPWLFWFMFKRSDSSLWTPLTTSSRTLKLEPVQRVDEGCYICNATNSIGPGDNSEPVCINVLFAPTKVGISMAATVREDQLVTVNCTAESFPPSEITLTAPESASWYPKWGAHVTNQVIFIFNATSAHAGSYTCTASNSEGKQQSQERKLVVEYSPKDVRVEAWPGFDVKENHSFSLECNSHYHPEVTLYTWTKMTNGNRELVAKSTKKTYSVKSASLSHSGLYSCTAQNQVGIGKSKQVNIRVKYAPKHTTIITGEEQWETDGKGSVMLSCSSHSYPPPSYVWYNKTADDKVSEEQNLTVYSHQAGEYYCLARNELGGKPSDRVRLFDGDLKILIYILVVFLLIVVLLIFVYRKRIKRSIQPGAVNESPCVACLPCWSGARGGCTMNETGLAEPCRSRDDLLLNQPRRPSQPRPDATSVSNIHSIYSIVTPVHRKEALPVQNPVRQQHGCMESDSLNYASLHFDNKQKKPEEGAVYSKVCKPFKEEQQEGNLQDYENIVDVHAAKRPNPYSYDSSDTSDTSDDEVEVSYTQVNFKPKSGNQREKSDSSTSEDETQYSQVKL
ncbi:unnamed protein product [Menidia menidia]|uniref:B-cell receptor CD22 n=1 Tax=Menidia menidia TaxID=238744 RepID=A0A8S4BTH3_9TELE|nr:unnamed protein product [Menidia menidia]